LRATTDIARLDRLQTATTSRLDRPAGERARQRLRVQAKGKVTIEIATPCIVDPVLARLLRVNLAPIAMMKATSPTATATAGNPNASTQQTTEDYKHYRPLNHFGLLHLVVQLLHDGSRKSAGKRRLQATALGAMFVPGKCPVP